MRDESERSLVWAQWNIMKNIHSSTVDKQIF